VFEQPSPAIFAIHRDGARGIRNETTAIEHEEFIIGFAPCVIGVAYVKAITARLPLIESN
jgi:hypothetical protein